MATPAGQAEILVEPASNRIVRSGAQPIAVYDWDKVSPPSVDTLHGVLAWAAKRGGERIFYDFDDATISYAELQRRSGQFAMALMRAGIGRKSRVGLFLPNGPDFLVSWFAIARTGAVAVPISTLSTAAELRDIGQRAGLRLLIATSDFLGHSFVDRIEAAFECAGGIGEEGSPVSPDLRDIWFWGRGPAWARTIDLDTMPAVGGAALAAIEAQITAADEAGIIFTSGSTSRPKGVIHSHGNFVRATRRWGAAMPYSEGEKLFYSAPAFWVGGIVTGFLSIMQVGGTLVGTSSKAPDKMLDKIAGSGANYFKCSADVARMLEPHVGTPPRDFSAIKASTLRAIVPPELRTRNQVYLGNTLGMTETMGPHTFPLQDIEDAYRGSMGPATIGMEHRIVDPATRAPVPDGMRGELLVRGDTMMLGYVGRERQDVLDADGWFATNDECAWVDGHLILYGRLDDMIKSAGANVSPAEVEAALIAIDGVNQACVVGLPDPERGKVVVAMIVPEGGAQLSADAITARLKQTLSAYKVPRRLLFAGELPATATGKVSRNKVREAMAAADAPDETGREERMCR